VQLLINLFCSVKGGLKLPAEMREISIPGDLEALSRKVMFDRKRNLKLLEVAGLTSELGIATKRRRFE